MAKLHSHGMTILWESFPQFSWLYQAGTLKNMRGDRTSLVAQWLRLCDPNAGGPCWIPGPGNRSHMHATTKSSHATTKEPVSHN